MMSVPLEDGENVVELSWAVASAPSPLGRILPWAALVLAVWWLVLGRKRPDELPPKWLGTVSLVLFYAGAAAVAGFVYAAPTVLLLIRGHVVWF